MHSLATQVHLQLFEPTNSCRIQQLTTMPDQYDAIATLYGKMQPLPGPSIEQPSVEAILGDTTRLRCLDLACGLGRWSKFLLEKGAADVVEIDISELMTEGAAREATTAWPVSISE
jgi:2-polyprenyl-3-methyl-5-hydroxy-6-metoxy-1,4-benzoquinol methylase